MKTYKHLYPQIIAYSNLLIAWQKARQGKRYTSAAAAFERNLDLELVTLHTELADETYLPGSYRSFAVHEPKRRTISAAPFRDRVVHHALCNIIGPIYEHKFIYDSYANRVGKGTHRALDRCTEFMRRYAYVLPCDVQQFFPAIDHAILKRLLARTIADQQTIRLCEKIIDSGAGILRREYDLRWFPGDDLLAATRPRGLPIGNLTSQFWANVYLNEIDQFAKHTLKCRAYIRYVDDVLLFADDKRTLHAWRDEIVAFLRTLRLTLHEYRAQPRPVTHALPFLGFIVYPDHRRLKPRTGLRYRRHLRALHQRYRRGEMPRARLDASVRAWVGHAMHGDTWGLRTKMLSEIQL